MLLRPSVAAAGLTFAVWLLAYAQWGFGAKTVPWDSKNQFYAFFRFLGQSIAEGHSPFWNPYHYGGHPSIADPQSLLFSPPFLLLAWLDPTASMATFDLLVYAHLLVGGLAIVAYGSRRDWPVAASVLAASVFMLGGAAAGRLNHTGIILSYGLFPVAALTLEIALQRRSLVYSLAFAAVASAIVLGRNQVALLLCFVLIALALAPVATATRPLRYLSRRWHLVAVMILIGIALNAVPFLLTLQFAQISNRPEVPLSAALEASLHPSVLLTSAVANLFGSHNLSFDYYGPHYTIMPEVASTDDSFNYVFFGATPMLLLVWFGIAGGRVAAHGARVWAIVLAVALLFSLGRYGPLFPFVFEQVPGFAFFRRPIDGMFVAGIAIAFLSGHLVADYARNGRPSARPVPAAIVLVAVGAIGVAAFRVAGMSHREWSVVAEIARTLPVLALAAVILLAARGTLNRRFAAAAVTLLATGELVAWNAAARFNAEPSAVYAALETVTPEQRAALDVLGRELALRHRQGARPRVEILNMGGPWQNLAMVREIEATNGYNPLRIGRYDRMISPGEASTQGRMFTAAYSGFDCALARALGVEYLVSGEPIEALKPRSNARHAELIHAGPGIYVYRFEKALPRAIFHAHIEVADGDAFNMDGRLRHPPTSDRALIDDETPLSRPYWIVPVSDAEGATRIRSWRPDRVEVDVRAPTNGVLVLHDLHYPGWTATIDGEPVGILRADTLFRGVEIPAGHHRVVFEFKPLSWQNLSAAVATLLNRSGR